MFIKKFYQTAKDTRLKLKAADSKKIVLSDDEYKMLRAQDKAFNAFIKYIKNGDWARSESRDKLYYWLLCDCDIAMACNKFMTSRDCFYVFLFRQNAKLEKVLSEPYARICAGLVDEGLSYFYSLSGQFSVKNSFSFRVLDSLPEAEEKDSLSWRECEAEAQLLKGLMKSSLQSRVDAVDKEKLSYLLFLLSTDVGIYHEQKRQFLDFLMSRNDNIDLID